MRHGPFGAAAGGGQSDPHRFPGAPDSRAGAFPGPHRGDPWQPPYRHRPNPGCGSADAAAPRVDLALHGGAVMADGDAGRSAGEPRPTGRLVVQPSQGPGHRGAEAGGQRRGAGVMDAGTSRAIPASQGGRSSDRLAVHHGAAPCGVGGDFRLRPLGAGGDGRDQLGDVRGQPADRQVRPGPGGGTP